MIDRALASLTVCAVLLAAPAEAFCGFYVSSAGGQLFNDATMVTLMRDGTRRWRTWSRRRRTKPSHVNSSPYST